MIQPFDQRVGRLLEVAVIDEVAPYGIDIALHNHFKPEGMPMQPAALVVWRKCRQIVRRLKVKRFG